MRKSILPKFIRILTIGTGAFAGIALFATIGELFQYHGRGNFLHKETIELIKPQNSKDFTIDIHSLPEIKSLVFPSGNEFIRQNRTIHLHPTFDQSFKAEYTYTIYFAQNKKGKARFQQMIEHLIKPSQKRE